MLITDQSKIAQGAMDDLTIVGQKMGIFCPNVVNNIIYELETLAVNVPLST